MDGGQTGNGGNAGDASYIPMDMPGGNSAKSKGTADNFDAHYTPMHSRGGRLLKEKLAFVESEAFQTSMGLVILANVIVLAGETDSPGLSIWDFADNFFLVIFIVEVLAKMFYHGPRVFFVGLDMYWNFFDLALVLSTMFETWFSQILSNRKDDSNDMPSLLRVLRLIRLLRVLRLFRVVKQLMSLVTAFQAMLESFAVVFGILSMILLSCGVICTEFLGRVNVETNDTAKVKAMKLDIKSHFKDVETSLFSLFQVTTLDNWIDIAQPAIDLNVYWECFFVGFICVASWTMIAILTAVASENVVESAMGREEAIKKEIEMKQAKFLNFLRDAFVSADTDGNGLLDKEEFEALIHRQDVETQMRASSALTIDDLIQAWETLDINRTGELTIDEFVSGLAVMNEGLSTKHIASLEWNLQQKSLNILSHMGRLQEQLSVVEKSNNEVLRMLRIRYRRGHSHAESMSAWRRDLLSKESIDNDLLYGRLRDLPEALYLYTQ